MRNAFRSVSRGSCAAEPASCFGKLVHIVPYAFGNGFALKLRENRSYIHHCPSHGRTGVKVLADRDKGNSQTFKLLNKSRKIADISAYSIKSVAYHGGDFFLPCIGHHLLKLRSVSVPAGEAFVLIDDCSGCFLPAVVGEYVLSAKLNLVFYAFSFSCKFGFSGVYGYYTGVNLGHC